MKVLTGTHTSMGIIRAVPAVFETFPRVNERTFLPVDQEFSTSSMPTLASLVVGTNFLRAEVGRGGHVLLSRESV